MGPIFIPTSSFNRSAHVVARLLRERNYDAIVFNADKVLDGSIPFSLLVKDGKSCLSYGDRIILLDDITSALYWGPQVYFVHADYGHQVAIEREMRMTLQGVWSGVKESAWINSPERIAITQSKAPQMARAQRVGLQTPTTILTNQWSSIDSIGDTTILKMPGIGLIDGANSRALYTTILDSTTRATIHETSPFPGMHQPFISKKREWRITVVGDRVFPAAIYTKSDAKDDWRKYAHDRFDNVIFKQESLPDSTIETKCKLLLQDFGLRYGAFDFIETPDGEMLFLEVNSAGQYGWLEAELGLPISEAIADLLIDIAKA